jgi:hypothetical protein
MGLMLVIIGIATSPFGVGVVIMFIGLVLLFGKNGKG